jgi:D-serine deaminase-like pyridoxal phosphate-dependent protein
MIRINHPTLLLDKEKCLRNILQMAAKARQHKLKLVPHFKTHQSITVGNWFRDYGVESITVSSVKMADYFARQGWKEIFIAFPLNVRELDNLNQLSNSVKLTVVINSQATLAMLRNKIQNSISFKIEIDTGYQRSGIPVSAKDHISNLINEADQIPDLHFSGFYLHDGRTYQAEKPEEVVRIFQESLALLKELKSELKAHGNIALAMGDTPGASLATDFSGLSSLHAGNFVYYDLTQVKTGAADHDQIAVCLACPVVDKYPARQEVIIHCGWVHLGQDILVENGQKIHGKVVRIQKNGWSDPVPGCYVRSLSQEHGTIHLEEPLLQEIKPGDLLGILPVHSCATAEMMRELITLDGEKIQMMPKVHSV